MKTWEGDCPPSAPPAICSGTCPSNDTFCHTKEGPGCNPPPPLTQDPMYCPESVPPDLC